MDYKRNYTAYFIAVLVIAHVFWWIKFQFITFSHSFEPYLFNLGYGIVALIGGLNGIFIAKTWGGLKSVIGRAIVYLSLALVFEFLAVFTWSMYNIFLKVEIPYPSIADFFYFGVIPLLIFTMLNLGRGAGASTSIKTIQGKVYFFVIPTLGLLIAYYLFLSSTELDFSNPIRTFFDLMYPIGYTVTIAFAILTYLLTRNYLGGIMKKPILFFLGSYILLFISDYSFLYTSLTETYTNGNWVDLMYAISLGFLSLSIIAFDTLRGQVKLNGNVQTPQVTSTSTQVWAKVENVAQVIKQIVEDQEKIVGPIAYMQANSIEGLSYNAATKSFTVNKDPALVLNTLVQKYQALFGKASLELIKNSINKNARRHN